MTLGGYHPAPSSFRPPSPMKSFAATCLLLAASVASASAPVPEPPALQARSYVLMDYDSGQVLAAKQPKLRVEPASLAKLMTLYIAFDEIKTGRAKPDDLVLVSEKAWRQGMDSRESRMFIEVGKRVALQDLIHGIIIQSGNDATVAVAEHFGGSEEVFVGLMNQYAKKLGMTGTHYANSIGIPDPELYTTAEDVALLSRALIRDFPDEYPLFKEKEFVFNKIRQRNRNRLLWRDPSVDGIKTGHTESAGHHLAASATRDGRRLISVVIGMDSEEARAQASLALLNYGFRFYESVAAVAPGAPVTTIRPWKGAVTELPLGVAAPLTVSVPRGAGERLQVKPQVDGPVFAPVAAGQKLGTLTVLLDGRPLRVEPLVALAEVPEGGLWRRLTDEIRMRFEGISPP